MFVLPKGDNLPANLGNQRRVPQHTLRPGCVYARRAVCVALCLIGSLVADSAWAQSPPAQTAAAPAAPNAPSPMQGSIRGVVTSDDGSEYEGARVQLTFSRGSDPAVASRQTDSDGAFSFTGLPEGSFTLAISANGFLTRTVTGTLRAGEAFDAHTIVLPVAAAAAVVRVSAEPQVEIAQEQLNVEEQQRVLGVFPNYYVSYDRDAVPLTPGQKFQLAWKTEINPVTWAVTGAIAGAEQAENTFAGYGQGAQGYAKRFGANYADGFIGNMIGGAILPSVLKQDPRYFYKGTGSVMSRALYAIANSVICKGDNGHWQPNYSGIVGGLAAGGISNLYYPASDRNGITLTFENTMIGTGEGAVQNLFQEFVVRHLTPKVHINPPPSSH